MISELERVQDLRTSSGNASDAFSHHSAYSSFPYLLSQYITHNLNMTKCIDVYLNQIIPFNTSEGNIHLHPYAALIFKFSTSLITLTNIFSIANMRIPWVLPLFFAVAEMTIDKGLIKEQNSFDPGRHLFSTGVEDHCKNTNDAIHYFATCLWKQCSNDVSLASTLFTERKKAPDLLACFKEECVGYFY